MKDFTICLQLSLDSKNFVNNVLYPLLPPYLISDAFVTCLDLSDPAFC